MSLPTILSNCILKISSDWYSTIDPLRLRPTAPVSNATRISFFNVAPKTVIVAMG